MKPALKVAKSFSRLLQEEIGKSKLATVVKRNQAEKNPNICHTHDFCDANMVMLKAMQSQGLMSDDTIPLGDQDNDLWNAAWDLAKKAEFDHSRIK